METKDLLKFIVDNGYRTLEEIKKQYSDEDPEVLETQLSYMASKNNIRKITYQTSDGKVGDLFYALKG
jgi:hypothetical protein